MRPHGTSPGLRKDTEPDSAAQAAEHRSSRLRGDPNAKGLSPLGNALISIVLGIAAGFGAFVLRSLIGAAHNLLFEGRLELFLDTQRHSPPSPWGAGIVLAPVLGSFVVVYLVKNFAPEAKGHGVPEVMDAIYYHKAVIRPVVAAVKSVASAISIGSGGSVGREGPIIQIGAAVGSWLGRACGVSRWQLATLVAAGGGAGIAATFNTPIGGVLFAVEILMHEVSVRTLVPVALATATATYVGQQFFGDHPAFEIPALHFTHAVSAQLLPAWFGLGCLMGVVAAVFIRSLYACEDAFERLVPRRPYLRHALGMLGVGSAGLGLMWARGHYFVFGVGYATIMDVLLGKLGGAWFLVALFALKLAVTSLTLGSGASGGIFSPSLFMGATLGSAYGLLLHGLLPGLDINPAALAVVGMAALLAGTTGAALTAIVMIFEMTLDYGVVLPMTLTVAVAYGVRRMLLPQSIYTMKLVRRGHYMPEALLANAHLVHHAGELQLDAVALRERDAPVEPPADAAGRPTPAYYVVLQDGQVDGVVAADWLAEHPQRLAGARSWGELARRDFIRVRSDATLFDVLAAFAGCEADLAVVLAAPGERGIDGSQVRGLISKSHIADAVADGMELFRD